MVKWARTTYELFEYAALGTGLNLIMASAGAMSVVSFLGLPLWLSVIAVLAGVAGLGAGAALHIGSRAAQDQRNARLASWLDTMPASELPELRADLVERRESMAAARNDWFRPLGAAILTMISTVVVPYELMGAHSPNFLVEPINTVWVAATVLLALFCLGTTILAAIDTDPSEPADDQDHVLFS